MVNKVTLVDYITLIKEKRERIENRYLSYNLDGYLSLFLIDNSFKMWRGLTDWEKSRFTYVEWCLNRHGWRIENGRNMIENDRM